MSEQPKEDPPTEIPNPPMEDPPLPDSYEPTPDRKPEPEL